MRKFIQETWLAMAAVLGIAILAYAVASDFYATGRISLDFTLVMGVAIFVFFVTAAIIRANRKSREARKAERRKHRRKA